MFPPLPTGSETHSGVLAELLEHLERRRLLALEPVRVHRVQERERAPLDELAHEPQRVVEVALHRDDARAADLGLGELPARDRPLGQDDRQADAGPAAVRGRRRRRVAGRRAHRRGGAVLERLRHGHRHPPVLERPGGIGALVLQVDVDADQGRDPRAPAGAASSPRRA